MPQVTNPVNLPTPLGEFTPTSFFKKTI